MFSQEFNQPAVLYNVTQVDDDAGHPTEVETKLCDVWLAFGSGTGREFNEAKQLDATVTHMVRMRYLPGITVVPNHRLKYDSRTFEILSAVDEREAHQTLVMSLMENSESVRRKSKLWLTHLTI